MRERELYPNAPIVLAAVEVRHSLCDPLESPGLARVTAAVRSELPIRGEVREMEFAFQAGPGGPASTPGQALPPAPRWSSRDKRTALTLKQDAVVVETTDYRSYERIREIVKMALEARANVGGPDGISRIGLRYIDEIRVPGTNGDDGIRWDEWVDSALLGPVSVGSELGLRPAALQGICAFAGANDRQLILRYGPRDGYAVVSTPELRRPMPDPGTFFLLDIDSFWEPTDEIPAFAPDSILSIMDGLHDPIRQVFDNLITEKLRDEVLRNV